MKKITLLIALAVVTLATPSLGNAAPKDKKTAAKADTTKAETAYEKLMKEDPETHEGFITVHKSKSKVYFQIPLDILGREMLIGSTISEISDNGDALIGQKPHDPLHVTFDKVEESINLVKINKDYTTNSKREAFRKALDLNSAGSVINKFKIHSYVPDSSAVIIDVTDFFVSDNKALSPFDPYSQNTYSGQVSRNASFQSQNSFLVGVKAFPTNVSVKSSLSYKYSLNYRGRSLAEDVAFTAVVTRSILLLDEKPYKSRHADSRIAIFPTGKYLYNEDEQKSKIVYYVNRWRVEPSDTAAYMAGKTVDATKPIVFYIDPAFPQEWQSAIYEAVNQWQEPFERIGISNAIMAKPFPTDDPEFDPDNLKYSCIRYAPINIENAMGPSWVDPRSGEIINASVYVYHDVVKLINNWRFVQTSQADESVRSGNLPADVLHQSLSYVIGHEVGHCLGLMHNMSASATIPVDSLRSPTFTQKYGTTHSIMDYARFNYVAQPGDKERGVSLTPPKFGLYDYFTIDYSYRPVFGVSEEEEEEIMLTKLHVAQSDPVYRYGKQQGGVLDPRSQNEDLGDNAVKASRYGIANLKYIIPNINTWVENDDDFSYRNGIYEEVIQQYLRYVQHVFSYVGGVNLWEKYEGDAVEAAYKCVPREMQKEAFDFLCEQVRDLEWLDEPALIANMQMAGNPSRMFQRALAEAIVSCPAKILNCEMLAHDEPIYKFSDCLEDVYKFIWTPTMKGRKLTELDMMLQREFVSRSFHGAGFSYSGSRAAAKNISLVEPAHQHTHFCSHDECNAAINPYAGYDSPYTMFGTAPVVDSEYYRYAMKTKKLLEKKVKTAKGEDKAHYTLLLHNIEKALN